ncbi:diguanylate cyclase [Desulfobacterota bacterium M19]
MPVIRSYLKKVYSGQRRAPAKKHRPLLSASSSLPEINPAVDYISGVDVERDFSGFQHKALQLQLELLRQALGLTTAAFLWASTNGPVRLLSIVSERDDILRGPFERGAGLLGGLLHGRAEVSLTKVSKTYSGLIYYQNPGRTGSAIALRCQTAAADQDDKGFFILTADREKTGIWRDEDRALLRLCADKMIKEREFGELLAGVEHERSLLRKICGGLRELNRGLGLESVFEATARAVNNLLAVDFIAISLRDHDIHYTAFVGGGRYEELMGLEYGCHEGLVGQVLKLNLPLPANASYRGPAPIFSNKHCLDGFKSLLIVPLCPEKGCPIGALTVAALRDNIFGRQERDFLGLIADQAAIKIDLAQAHELISKMATTDGLTSLANHRSFQHGFDVMLHRAKRRESPLAMIICDIDFFKKFNDNYGHQFGDQVLKAVADVMARDVRREDLAARYGGEEFALILENSDKHGACLMAERIRCDIAALKFKIDGREVGVTISAGIAAYPEDAGQKADIIELADKALYRAKEGGRNQTILA